ncbi:DUF2189 domain-containing protein [Bosea sp. NPDC055332]
MADTHLHHDHVAANDAAPPDALPVNEIGIADIKDALRQGYSDFMAQPSHLLFIALIYPIAGVLLAHLTVSYNIFPLLFPLASGFALLGPFAAIGLYEISRRRELGMDTSWKHALDVVHSPGIGQIALLGGLLTGVFLTWLFSAWIIYRWLMGDAPLDSFASFMTPLLTTVNGWTLIILGNALGMLFAILVFSMTVISFPLMLDRHVDVGTAVKTSMAAVEKNPRVMLYWALTITALLVLGSLPVLVGLIIVMPVLGHASWHFYRKVVPR